MRPGVKKIEGYWCAGWKSALTKNFYVHSQHTEWMEAMKAANALASLPEPIRH